MAPSCGASTQAERIFNEIDTDRSGTIELTELAAYLAKEGAGLPPSKAHTLLMKLDADGDGKVSLEEWKVGWGRYIKW